jgi:hypothetical protein
MWGELEIAPAGLDKSGRSGLPTCPTAAQRIPQTIPSKSTELR